MLGILNDLWVFDVSLGQWKWELGTKSLNDQGSYGTLGVFHPSNLPPARSLFGSFDDQQTDDIYIFAGTLAATPRCLTDMWVLRSNLTFTSASSGGKSTVHGPSNAYKTATSIGPNVNSSTTKAEPDKIQDSQSIIVYSSIGAVCLVLLGLASFAFYRRGYLQFTTTKQSSVNTTSFNTQTAINGTVALAPLTNLFNKVSINLNI